MLWERNCYSIRWARNNRNKPDLYGLSLNPYLICMLNMVIPPIVPTYICLSSINRY
ncbi:transmembrane protein, putative [Medicago truncatula]|uniref:Transmembrane protein, putative n=1 Tax=Medicago truncatula TaxID=3880 RepID=A0A072THH7_MEDTR|nr:transmembrane protein, putative [Medicago truncatula]